MARAPQPLSHERETRLFEAAARAFLTQGFEASSLNRIIESAGMPKSSFYHYFTDKHDLHERMLRSLTGAVAEHVRLPDLALLDSRTFWSAMWSLLDDLGQMADERPETIELARMFYSSDELADDTAGPLRAAAQLWTHAALERGVELGVVRSDLPSSLLSDIAFAVLVAVDRGGLGIDAGGDAASHADRALGALQRLLDGN